MSGAMAASMRRGVARGVQPLSPALLRNSPTAVCVRLSMQCRNVHCRRSLDILCRQWQQEGRRFLLLFPNRLKLRFRNLLPDPGVEVFVYRIERVGLQFREHPTQLLFDAVGLMEEAPPVHFEVADAKTPIRTQQG